MLRSVSPIHIEYLQNMGVRASMSISLVKDNQLWGLISCHHYSGPHYVSYDVRTACELLGQVVSLQLVGKERDQDQVYALKLKATLAKWTEWMSRDELFSDGLIKHELGLLDFVDAGGAALCVGGACTLVGNTPPEPTVLELAAWLAEQGKRGVFSTNALPAIYPPAAGFKHTASGLLAVPLARTGQEYVLWFRPEVVQTVSWGGDPAKPAEVAADGLRLSPRKSFALWKETVHLRSLPWQPAEIDAAGELRSVVGDVVLRRAEALAQVNAELVRTNIELDAFAYVASHDLKEPLRGIHNYAQFLLEDYAEQLDEDGQAKLQTLTRLSQRMEDLINSLLHYSRIGRDEAPIELVDLNQVLAETLDLLKAWSDPSGVEVRVPRPLPMVRCNAVQVSEVFSNLIANAIKYNNKPSRWVEVGFVDPDPAMPAGEHSQPIVFYVRDNGIGIQEKHFTTIFRIFKRLHRREEFGGGTGAGLTIATRIVQRHGGRIWLESTYGVGTTFYFTLG